MAHETAHPAQRKSTLDALPPLPAVALRVMQVAQDPASSASDLALVISSDPGLSARILRIVNSAAYRRSEREVTSVQEALVVLGFVQARNVAISSAITSAYAPDSLNALFRISHFWRHSLSVAFKAAEIAASTRKLAVPSAFTAGILHNMGRLAMFHADPAGMDQAVAAAIGEGLTLEEAEDNLLDYNHSELGGALAMRWKLPAEIVTAIARHHEASPGDESLAAVVAKADEFCHANGILPGYVIPLPEGEAPPPPSPDMARLLRQVDGLMEMVVGESGANAA
ncbi:MAG: HDOD domain-containing protein [Dehalococcoidia bacterium]|nr:HDOD domain-containing protein [Dehalococcoidia bacterium]MCA9845843.1 HDOD domain-containing protein [Dehalococcoidia bacterium]MCA9852511.1 HDOD domain-containing protein [Dehalococcoidia bacterium]